MSNTPGAEPGSFGRTNLYQRIVAGGAVGPFTVPNLKSVDELASVLYFSATGTVLTGIFDLTAEFTISADATIGNTTTTTTGGKLLVTFHSAQPELRP